MSIEVQNFQEDVIRASSSIPIVVDFWAAWCGPCRVLGPVLEKLESEQAGKWRLAKVDTDANPELSLQYGIRGIPAVKLFIDGAVADEFTGALPEHAVRKWLEEAIPSESKALILEAEQRIGDGDETGAIQSLESLLADNPDHPKGSAVLARLLAFRDPERAKVLAELVKEDPEFKPLSDAVFTLEEFKSKDAASITDDDKSGLGEYLGASLALREGDIDRALNALIEVLKTNRYLDDDGARKMGISLFVLLGDAHPLTKKYRRTFDMWLY